MLRSTLRWAVPRCHRLISYGVPVAVAVTVGGCDRIGGPVRTVPLSTVTVESKSNVTSTSSGAWTLTAWNSGGCYGTGRPIDVTLRISREGTIDTGPLRPKVSARMRKAGNEQVIREVPREVAFGHLDGARWQAKIDDLFPHTAWEPAPFRDGSYELDIEVTLEDGTCLTLRGMGIMIQRTWQRGER